MGYGQLSALWLRIKLLWKREQLDRDLDDEIALRGLKFDAEDFGDNGFGRGLLAGGRAQRQRREHHDPHAPPATPLRFRFAPRR